MHDSVYRINIQSTNQDTSKGENLDILTLFHGRNHMSVFNNRLDNNIRSLSHLVHHQCQRSLT